MIFYEKFEEVMMSMYVKTGWYSMEITKKEQYRRLLSVTSKVYCQSNPGSNIVGFRYKHVAYCQATRPTLLKLAGTIDTASIAKQT